MSILGRQHSNYPPHKCCPKNPSPNTRVWQILRDKNHRFSQLTDVYIWSGGRSRGKRGGKCDSGGMGINGGMANRWCGSKSCKMFGGGSYSGGRGTRHGKSGGNRR